jgi:Tfp pilus assembly protein PilO
MNSFKNWVIGTSLLCAVVLGLGAFLLVKPQLDQANELDAQTEALAVSNDDLAEEVADLKEQFSHIDEYRASLASAQTRVPQRADISAMLREINAVATASGVTLITSSPGAAQAWVAPEADEQATGEAEDADGAAADEASEEDEAAAEEVAAAAEASGDPLADALATAFAQEVMDLDGFYAVPITVDVVGPYANVRTFIDALQRTTQRYFYAGDLTLTRLDPADASDGRPAVSEGDVEVAIAVSAFVLTPSGGTVAVPDDPTTPLPAGERNPFTGAAASD